MIQKGVIGALWWAAVVARSFSINCHPPAQGSLTEAGSSQAVEFSTGATVWQQLNYYDTSHNQRCCREHRHLFGAGAQGVAMNGENSTQVQPIKLNAWAIWLIQGHLRGKGCRQLTDIIKYKYSFKRKNDTKGYLSAHLPDKCACSETPKQW